MAIMMPSLLAAGCGPQVVNPGGSSPMPPAAMRGTTAAPAGWGAAAGDEATFGQLPAVPAASVVDLPPAKSETWHEVQKGDTLTAIARQHGTSVGKLVEANGLDVNAPIKPGQMIVIP